MSFKGDNLVIILNRLSGKEKTTVQTLMAELGVKERTIHRYLDTLLVAGFPIEYSRKEKSYVFSEGYALAKPDLSIEETLALALAKNFMSSFGTQSGEGNQQHRAEDDRKREG